MVNVNAHFKRLLLRLIYDECTAGQGPSPKFYECLKAWAFGQVKMVQHGRIISSTSANGHSTQFDSNGLSPIQITELSEEFLTFFDNAVQELGPGATDKQIFEQMKTDYRSVTGYTHNWMYLAK